MADVCVLPSIPGSAEACTYLLLLQNEQGYTEKVILTAPLSEYKYFRTDKVIIVE